MSESLPQPGAYPTSFPAPALPKAKVLTLGWACLDQRFYVEHFPPTHSRTPVKAFREALGGPATVAAQAVVRLGGHATLLSRRGQDTTGDLLERLVRQEGIEPIFTIGQNTPVSAVLVTPSGERYIFPYRGILPLVPEWSPMTVLEGVQAVLIDHRWPEASLTLAKEAQKRGVPVVLDLDHDREEAWALVPYSSHVVASEELAQQVGGIEAFFARVPGFAAVTLGANGVTHREGHIAAFKVNVLDSTGAGDVYHGAFTLALAEGQNQVAALRFAAAVSALHVQRGHPPNRPEVEGLLR